MELGDNSLRRSQRLRSKSAAKQSTPTAKKPSPTAKQSTPTAKQSTSTKRLSRVRAKSLELFRNKENSLLIRKYRSLSYSPTYAKKINLSLLQNMKIQKPNEILRYRLETFEYLQKIKDPEYYLNLQKPLANIEKNATGIVCLSNNSKIVLNGKSINNFKFAIKIAKIHRGDSDKEIYILNNMVDFIKKGFHNFPLIYQSFRRKKNEMKDTEINDINVFFKKYAKFNVYANELANGDLKTFLYLYNDGDIDITEEVLLNAVVQILFSIASLHDVGIRHNDTHFGNFLYHKIKPGGYIKYTIKNETYYVKNLGYLWVIWDFGIASQINGICICDYFYDYEMFSLFLRKDEGKYNMRFGAMQGKKEVRRLHGNLIDFQRELPEAILELTNTIYNLSIDQRKKMYPDISIEEGNKLLKSKDIASLSKISSMSLPCYEVIDYKKVTDKKVVDETVFLTKYVLPLFSSVFVQNTGSISDDDIVFHVDLKMEPFIIVRKSDGARSDADTIERYKGEKIVILKEYCI